MPKEPYSNPNHRPPVFAVSTCDERRRIVALFTREEDAWRFKGELTDADRAWLLHNGRVPYLEVTPRDPADAVQQLVLEQDLYDQEGA